MIELKLQGHDDRYAVEQLCLALFDLRKQVQVVSQLHRGKNNSSAPEHKYISKPLYKFSHSDIHIDSHWLS